MWNWIKKLFRATAPEAMVKVEYEPTPVVKAAIDLMHKEPDQWERDTYHMTHSSGMKIWVSTGAWALQIYIDRMLVFDKSDSISNPSKDHKLLWKTITEDHPKLLGALKVKGYLERSEENALTRRARELNAAVDRDIAMLELKHGVKKSKSTLGPSYVHTTTMEYLKLPQQQESCYI